MLFRLVACSIIACAVGTCARGETMLHATNLQCEYRTDPLGIDSRTPRLSWILESSKRGAAQSAYQIVVASSLQQLAGDRSDLWDSTRVPANETIQIAYAGKPLVSRQACFWKVRVWDQAGQ